MVFERILPTVAAAKSLQSCPTLCDPRDGSSFSMPNMGQVQGTQEESPLHSQSGGGGKNRHNDSILEIGTITNRSQEVWATQGGNYNYLREEGESGRLPR